MPGHIPALYGGALPAGRSSVERKEIMGIYLQKNNTRFLIGGGGTKELEKRLAAVEQGRASGTAYGLVKLSDSVAVTDSIGFALPASENNAGMPGTLANRVEQNRRHLEWKTICDGVLQEDVPDLRPYVGKAVEFYVRVAVLDNWTNFSRIFRGDRAWSERSCAMAGYNIVFELNFNTWDADRQIEVNPYRNNGEDVFDVSDAKISVYYR